MQRFEINAVMINTVTRDSQEPKVGLTMKYEHFQHLSHFDQNH